MDPLPGSGGDLGEIPGSHEQNSQVSQSNGGSVGGVVLDEVPVERPWVKDYDAIKGEGPTRWPKRFDVLELGTDSSPRQR